MKRSRHAGLFLPLAVLAFPAIGQPPPQSTLPLPPQDKLLREIYQELVEINTTDSAGGCTQAARAMAARLKAGGYTDAEMQLIIPPGGQKKGNLVARLKGSGAKKPLMLLAHIDVVEAKREDWERDPFKLIAEGGHSKNYRLPGEGRGPILVEDSDTHIGHRLRPKEVPSGTPGRPL